MAWLVGDMNRVVTRLVHWPPRLDRDSRRRSCLSTAPANQRSHSQRLYRSLDSPVGPLLAQSGHSGLVTPSLLWAICGLMHRNKFEEIQQGKSAQSCHQSAATQSSHRTRSNSVSSSSSTSGGTATRRTTFGQTVTGGAAISSFESVTT
jgi:hypothetical protein